MDGIGTSQLITAASTLAGVVLTLLVNAFLERSRARDALALEMERAKSQHASWIREERRKAYGHLASTGEEFLQFIRNELVPLAEGPVTEQRLSQVDGEWRALRTQMRLAYNEVLLVGVPEVRDVAKIMWRTARDGINDALRLLTTDLSSVDEFSARVAEAVRGLCSLGDPYMEACRKDLQE